MIYATSIEHVKTENLNNNLKKTMIYVEEKSLGEAL